MSINISKWSKARKAFVAGVTSVTVMAAAMLGFGFTNTTAASCPTNDIMPCGASAPSTFISKLKANSPSDMQTIYADGRYKLPTSEYNRFASKAKAGKINPDTGNITVNGVTVGMDAQSIGRNSKSVSRPISIGGKTYYESPIRLLTKYTNDAMVLFDSKGNVQTVVMNLCGNPMTVKPNNPSYNCTALRKTQNNRNTYSFTTEAAATNGATITKVVYDFGDGKTATSTSLSTPVQHVYASPGNYTVKATVYVKTTFGESEFAIPVGTCTTTAPVAEEPKPVIDIVKTVDGVERKEVPVNTNFVYNLKVTNTGNVDLKDVVVTDQAPANVQFVSTDKVTIANNALSYTVSTLAKGQSVTINITAKLTKYVAGDIVNKACVETPTIPGTNPDDCDEAVVTTPEPKVPGVKIEKLVNGKDTITTAVNAEFTYGLKVTNTGQVDLTKVVVTDQAPANVAFLSTDNKGSVEGNKLNYTIDSLKVGESVMINIKAKVTTQVEGNIKNTACVNAPEVNPNEPTKDDDCDDAYVNVPPVVVTNPDISIVKTVNDMESIEIPVGQVFTYKIVVKNTGDVDMKNVVVVDNAPAGVTLISSESGSTTANKWTVTIDELKVGESKTYTIQAKVAEYKAGAMVNTACVNAPEVNPSEPTKDDACDYATVTVPAPVTPTPVTPVTPPQVLGKETGPEVLPNTGAGEVIAVAAAVAVVAGFAHRLFFARKFAND